MNDLYRKLGKYKYTVGYHPKFMGINYTPPDYVMVQTQDTYNFIIWEHTFNL